MRFRDLAASLLRRAELRVGYAQRALKEGAYPDALRLVGVDYPKKHDLSAVLLAVGEKFPEWFKVKVEFMADASRKLAARREISLYGDEEHLTTPEDAINREEATRAVRWAKEIHESCKQLAGETSRGD